MSFSYSGQPGSNSLDAVRFLINDTNPSSVLMQDEEIQWLISENTGIYAAAAQAAGQLSTQFARLGGGKRLGDLSVSFVSRASEYRALAKALNIRAMRTDLIPKPYAGGISETDKLNDEQDPDIVKRFKVSRVPDVYLNP